RRAEPRTYPAAPRCNSAATAQEFCHLSDMVAVPLRVTVSPFREDPYQLDGCDRCLVFKTHRLNERFSHRTRMEQRRQLLRSQLKGEITFVTFMQQTVMKDIGREILQP